MTAMFVRCVGRDGAKSRSGIYVGSYADGLEWSRMVSGSGALVIEQPVLHVELSKSRLTTRTGDLTSRSAGAGAVPWSRSESAE